MSKSKSKPWTKFMQSFKTKFEQNNVRQWVLAVLVFIGLYGILSINISPIGYQLEVGEVARQDIRVPRDMENRAQTQRAQQEAAAKAEAEAKIDPNFYIVNHAVVVEAEERLDTVFAVIADARIEPESDSESDAEETAANGQREPVTVQKRLAQVAEIVLPINYVERLLAADELEYNTFAEESKRIIMEQMKQRISESDVSYINDRIRVLFAQSDIRFELQEAAVLIAGQVIKPNLALDQQAVEQRRQEAVRAVKPVIVKAGEIIISDGTVVGEEHIQMLKDLGLYQEGIDYWSLLGLLIIVVLLLLLFAVSLYKYQPDIIKSESRLAFVGSVLILVTLITKILSLINWLLIMYLTPIALAGMLVTMLLDSRTGYLTVTVLSVISGIIFQSLPLVVQGLIGGLIAILSVSKVSQRSELMRAGFIVGGSNFLVMMAFGLLQGDSNMVVHSYLGMLNGLICSISTIGLLPYFESVFGITSAIRLLELTNPNHPLLRRLLMETPGTYHHSIMVGNLAEAAADAVGADGLLARVGSTFHDIGKIKRPIFFVENQLGADNPHDKIAPSLSTLIITAHVKDGVELAKEHKLPPVVTSFISEHHGTDLVKYFYHRALEANEGGVEESDFRYPGPKPQTKETAIVSLADAVEAAVRSLPKPTPGKIEGLVRKIIRDRLDDGQLDESDLTFKDLNKIADAFSKVLIGIFHGRIEYPEKITREEIEGKGK
ncbi:MAG TPA: HDIG domain-containing protein [Firmicutes bacterium]|nr:HDIG domain-containing protein [Bacillota bacterium]